MSFTDARANIAAALDGLAFLTGHEFRPPTLKAGTAYPLFDEALQGPGRKYGGQWRVIVVLGQDEKQAASKLDEWLPPIIDTLLQNVAHVDRCRAVAPKTDQGEIFALELTVRSE